MEIWNIFTSWMEKDPDRYPGDFVEWVYDETGNDVFNMFTEHQSEAFSRLLSNDPSTAESILEGLGTWP